MKDINSALHCQSPDYVTNTQTSGNIGEYDVSAMPKVGRLLKLFLDQCLHPKNYVLSRELTLDEMMIRFQGRSNRVYRRQPKPTSLGMT